MESDRSRIQVRSIPVTRFYRLPVNQMVLHAVYLPACWGKECVVVVWDVVGVVFSEYF